MVVVTGAAGFIGSRIIDRLRQPDLNDEIVAVDLPERISQANNLHGYEIAEKLDHETFVSEWLPLHAHNVDWVIHMGACSDTMADKDTLLERNLIYSMRLWDVCTTYQIQLVYASSAAVYGDGERGFDDEVPTKLLTPLNAYGDSKAAFDDWAVRQSKSPPDWAGLRFFNVYGPHESEKGRMASMAYQLICQANSRGYVELFESDHYDYKDGNQVRDFIYVDDVVKVILHMGSHIGIPVGCYNVGTGIGRTFNELALAIFKELGRKPDIRYIALPDQLKWRYQYYTQAMVEKLREKAQYRAPFTTLEDGVKQYLEWLHL